MGARESQSGCPWNESGHVYTSVRSSGNVDTTLPKCAFYPGKYSQPEPTGGVYVMADARATFGYADIGSVVPKPGDIHTPPGRNPHIVLSVVEATRNRFWKVTCRDIVLAYDLRDTATIYRNAPAPTASGLTARADTTAYLNVPCRLQPQTIKTVFDDRVEEVKGYKLFLGLSGTDQVEVQPGDIAVVSGVKYEITEQVDLRSVDSLTTAICERRE